MHGESTEGRRDLMHVGQYHVTFDEVSADIEHRSTRARYRVHAVTVTNAVDFMKHHQRLVFAMMGNFPGALVPYRVQQHPEGGSE